MGGVQNVRRRSVVLLQFDNGRIRKVLLEVEDVPDVGSSPLVDALVVVTDHADVPVTFREVFDEFVLRPVGVLILVDHDVSEAVAVPFEDRLVLFEKSDRVEKKIVEVHGVVPSEDPVILLVDLVYPFLSRILTERLPVIARAHLAFFACRDRRDDSVHGAVLCIDVEFFHYPSDAGSDIDRVVDHEVLSVSEDVGVTPQYPQARSVERHYPHWHASARELFDSFSHFSRRLVRESYGEDIVRGNPRIQKMRDAARHSARLAASRACEDQKRTLSVHYCSLLFIIQVYHRLYLNPNGREIQSLCFGPFRPTPTTPASMRIMPRMPRSVSLSPLKKTPTHTPMTVMPLAMKRELMYAGILVST